MTVACPVGRAGVCAHGCSGRRVVCCWAGLLVVPVGGGPPASRPRRELRSARRLEARPGPATAHGHRSQAPPPPTGTAARPGNADRPAAVSHRSGLVVCVLTGPAAAHRHRGQAPPVPRPGPAGLAAASNRSVCLCAARPGPAAAHGCRSQAPPAPRLGRPNLPCPPGRPNRLRTRIGYCDMDRL